MQAMFPLEEISDVVIVLVEPVLLPTDGGLYGYGFLL